MDARKEAEYREKCRNVITVLSTNSVRLTANFSKVDEIFAHYEIYKKHIHNNMKCKDTYTKTEPKHYQDN